MATYNGARYLAEQIKSILDQLEPDDELIICDDSSKDATVEIIRGINDPRIKLSTFDRNAGHVRNFERSLAQATGDYIFLSDQDDVWCPNKRNVLVATLAADPEILLAIHALATIDGDGHELQPRLNVWSAKLAGMASRSTFMARQLVRSEVAGCAVAFPRRLLDMALPFPPNTLAHDQWLSIAAPVFGKVVFVDHVLMRYRLHGGNVTPRGGLSWKRKLKYRMTLLRHIGTAISRRVAGV
jgi:glycosyltransferase involved in cell wall biosynthesis